MSSTVLIAKLKLVINFKSSNLSSSIHELTRFDWDELLEEINNQEYSLDIEHPIGNNNERYNHILIIDEIK